MTQEEFRAYLINLLAKASEPIEYDGDPEAGIAPKVHYPTKEEIADMLIANGIDDVSEYKVMDLNCANGLSEMIQNCDNCKLSECIGCEHSWTAVQEVKEVVKACENMTRERDRLTEKCIALQAEANNLIHSLEAVKKIAEE